MRKCLFGLIAALSFLGGCGKKPLADGQLPASPADLAPSLETTFKAADEGVRKDADEVRSSLQKDDLTGAFLQLNQMASNPKLTPGQQKVVLQTRAVLNQQLQERARQGDAQAAQVLQAYQSSK